MRGRVNGYTMAGVSDARRAVLTMLASSMRLGVLPPMRVGGAKKPGAVSLGKKRQMATSKPSKKFSLWGKMFLMNSSALRGIIEG